MTRILAQAIVDLLRPGTPPLFEVRVTGGLRPDDHCRTYTIEARDEGCAARDGMARFIEEMEVLADE